MKFTMIGAQSHIGHSFEIPEYTSEVSGLGTLRVLEAMRFFKFKKKQNIYQSKYIQSCLGKNQIKLTHLTKNL